MVRMAMIAMAVLILYPPSDYKGVVWQVSGRKSNLVVGYSLMISSRKAVFY